MSDSSRFLGQHLLPNAGKVVHPAKDSKTGAGDAKGKAAGPKKVNAKAAPNPKLVVASPQVAVKEVEAKSQHKVFVALQSLLRLLSSYTSHKGGSALPSPSL